MKRLIGILLALALALSALACGGKEHGAAQNNQNATDAPAQNETPGGVAPPSDGANGAVSGELMPGMFTMLGKAGSFELKGIRFSAERTGTPGGINNWEPSLTMIRTVFELDEWVAYTIQYEYGSAEEAKLGIWLFPHRELSEYSGRELHEMQDNAFFCEYELPYETYPYPLDDMLIVQGAAHKSGEYDMLLTVNGQIVGGAILRFLEKGALEGMSDEQIASMMAVG